MAVGYQELRSLLARLTRAMRLLDKARGGECGVTLAQCHMLVEAAKAEHPLAIGEIARLLGVDLSTASRVADGLVRRRLLRRAPSEADRRRVVLTLTPEGRRLVEKINEQMNAYTRRVLTALPPEHRKDVLASLSLLLPALEQGWSSGVDCDDSARAGRTEKDPS